MAEPPNNPVADPADVPPASRWQWLPAVVLAATVLAMYLRTTGYGYLNLDDPVYIVNNPYLRGLSWANVKAILTPGAIPAEVLYIPLTYLSYLLDSLVLGSGPMAHHAVNVVLHAANVVLVWALLRRWLDDPRGAFVGALLFAWHPLAAEPVAWVLGRKDLLAVLFCLIALLAWETGRLKAWRGALVVLAGLAAMLGKPTAIVLPALLLLIDWYRGRLSRRRGAWIAGLAAAGVAVFLLNRLNGAEDGSAAEPLWLTCLALPGTLAGWLRRLCLLEGTHFHYLRDEALAPARMTVLNWLPLLIAGALVVEAWRHRWRRVLFAIGFAAVAASPAITVVFSDRDLMTGDRYGYLALVGVAFLTGCLPGLGRGCRWRPGLAGALLCCAVAGVGTSLIVPAWKGPLSFWPRALAKSPGNPVARVAYGNALDDHGRFAEAAREYLAALRARPGYALAHNNLGNLLLRAGEPLRAARHYRYATLNAPDYVDAWANLGLALAQAGRYHDALAAVDEALRLQPLHADATYHRGLILLELGRLDDAEEVFRRLRALGYAPGRVWYSLGRIAVRRGDAKAAAEAFFQALNAEPGLLPAYLDLADVLEQAGLPAKAAEILGRGLYVFPGEPRLKARLEQLRGAGDSP